jgi:hypothetical protein
MLGMVMDDENMLGSAVTFLLTVPSDAAYGKASSQRPRRARKYEFLLNQLAGGLKSYFEVKAWFQMHGIPFTQTYGDWS